MRAGNLVSRTKGRTQIDGVKEQGSEENICVHNRDYLTVLRIKLDTDDLHYL
jgi:hypothetical protein